MQTSIDTLQCCLLFIAIMNNITPDHINLHKNRLRKRIGELKSEISDKHKEIDIIKAQLNFADEILGSPVNHKERLEGCEIPPELNGTGVTDALKILFKSNQGKKFTAAQAQEALKIGEVANSKSDTFRQVLYITLGRLCDAGIIDFIKKGKTKLYYAKSLELLN